MIAGVSLTRGAGMEGDIGLASRIYDVGQAEGGGGGGGGGKIEGGS